MHSVYAFPQDLSHPLPSSGYAAGCARGGHPDAMRLSSVEKAGERIAMARGLRFLAEAYMEALIVRNKRCARTQLAADGLLPQTGEDLDMETKYEQRAVSPWLLRFGSS